jgi:hypothetical protein
LDVTFLPCSAVVVEKLIKDGKAIQAVTFSCAFDLLDQFPPAPLLKSHINDAKKQANTILKSGNNSQSSQVNNLDGSFSCSFCIAVYG